MDHQANKWTLKRQICGLSWTEKQRNERHCWQIWLHKVGHIHPSIIPLHPPSLGPGQLWRPPTVAGSLIPLTGCQVISVLISGVWRCRFVMLPLLPTGGTIKSVVCHNVSETKSRQRNSWWFGKNVLICWMRCGIVLQSDLWDEQSDTSRQCLERNCWQWPVRCREHTV